MAITTNPTVFNITSEKGTTQDIVVSGLVYYGDVESDFVTLYVKVNGTTVKTIVGNPTTSSYTFSNIDFNAVKTAIYDAAVGKSLNNCVTLTIVNKSILNTNWTTTFNTLAGNEGDLTITAELTASASWVTKPTTSNPWDLDAVANPVLTLAWTRPHTGFRARIKFYIWDGSQWQLQFNRYYFTTSCNFDVTPYVSRAAMIADMGGVSPQDFKVELITQWQNAAADAVDISGVSVTKTYIDAVLHAFYDGSKVGIHNGTDWIDHETYIYNGTDWILQQVYVYNGTSWVESL